ncbi:MAG: AmmeMemoRadiSam system protein B [Candidatus Omnitrophica bacterium]|nr:AmmeMemoRadiSam system protein B [Candidatus Omnitrophota bacterium]
MERRFLAFGISLSVVFLLAKFGFAENIKQPNVAGEFYPDNPKQLSEMLDGFFEKADSASLAGEIFALISPHAGYGYSGQVAAYGYKLIQNKKYNMVIILGTSHRYVFNGASVYKDGYFKTPLGKIKVDNDFTAKLLNQDPEVVFDPNAFANEHSIEVQLPFLQKVLNNFTIVPIVLGDCSLQTCKNIASLLKNAIAGRKDILVVVSSDMYHGYDYEEADAVDKFTLKAIENMDAEAIYYGLRDEKMQLCGGFGVVTAIILAKDLGHDKVKVLRHTNSAEVTASLKKGSWTVGYSSVAIDQPQGEKAMLNKSQRKRLLEIARTTIESYLKTGQKPLLREDDPLLKEKRGAFVTLNENGELRGCIGNLVGTEPLYLTISNMAIESATGDPRFSPLELSELKNVNIEISVLSPMERIDNSDKIELGVHGVLVRKGFRSGVFLPQVATETGWSKDEFMSNLCTQKAGLHADAWKDKTTEVYVFSAEVFSEKDY